VRTRFADWAGQYGIVGDVRGLGAMVAFEVVRGAGDDSPAGDLAAHIVQAAYQGGLVLVKAGFYGNVIRFLAPLSITDEELARGLDILGRAVADAQRIADARASQAA
jgi:4-aminobutyrate aminotransferase/(S)-3-amino-2-methylpropionate transaminase